MHPGDLNLTTQVTGHGRFLFVRLPQRAVHAALAVALDGLGAGMENMYDVEGTPSAEALQKWEDVGDDFTRSRSRTSAAVCSGVTQRSQPRCRRTGGPRCP